MKKNTFKISVILAILVSFCFTCIFISCGPNPSTEVSAVGSWSGNMSVMVGVIIVIIIFVLLRAMTIIVMKLKNGGIMKDLVSK